MQQTIKEYILKEFAQDKTDLAYDSNLIQDGIVDSLGILMVISFIEKTYGAKIEPDDVVLENFESVNAIKALAERRKVA